ncbi:hypothetical protein [Pedobacter sp.]|uniref:hypothetical protein n=1 Tax=Pedobacter sp. TaxID=1411316 RepID=UPI003D7F5A60
MIHRYFLFYTVLLFLSLFGCTSKEAEKKHAKRSYIAIDGTDTAWLKVLITDARFKGKLEINFNNRYKDSGDVKGDVKGDTLLGDYHYFHYGLEWKRKAISLLKKNNTLVMGEGLQRVYLEIPFFSAEVPIKYDSVKFVFRLVDAP